MVIKGNIEFEGELLIQGKVQGDISSSPDSKGTLVIEEKAEVEGNVNVPVIKVGGVLRGDVASTELLHITSSGSIEGPVRYNNLQLESGSSVAGSLSPEFKAKPRSAT
jgi:cytoskeletal protein CcmA (bactofilin family)